MNRMRILILTVVLACSVQLGMVVPTFAATKDIVCNQITSNNLDPNCGANAITGSGGAVEKIINFLTFIVSVASVLIIIVAGLMYVLSGGNPQNTARAKDAIIYAVVGLVVALLARVIVQFVLNRV